MKKILIAALALLCMFSIVLSSCAPAQGNSDTTTAVADEPADTTTVSDVTTGDPEETTKESEETTADPSGVTTTADPSEETNDPENGGTEPEEEEPYTAVESYLPESTFNEIKTKFENKTFESGKVVAYVKQDTMPYALADVNTISNGKLKYITIPVVKTDAKDANGDFIFTISVIGNSEAGLKGSVKRAYQIKINAEKYGLTENNTSVFKFIKVDVSEYNIVLTSEETLAFLAKEDTIYPAYLFA